MTSQRHLNTGIHERIAGRDARRFVAPGASVAGHLKRRFKLPLQHPVQHVTHARRAVVGVVVVAIVLVRVLRIPTHVVGNGATLHGAQLQFLPADGAILTPVRGVEIRGTEAGHPVLGVTGEKAPEKIRLIEVKHAPVEGDVLTGAAVGEREGDVSELLEHELAGTVRDDRHRHARASHRPPAVERRRYTGCGRRRRLRHCCRLRRQRRRCEKHRHRQCTPNRLDRHQKRNSFPSSAAL